MLSLSQFLATVGLLAAYSQATVLPRANDNGACLQMRKTCAARVSPDLSNVWSIESCVVGATCHPSRYNVDGFLSALNKDKNGPQAKPYPKSTTLAPVSWKVFHDISTDGYSITTQNFIDAFYSQLSLSNGPWPSSADVVVGYFQRVGVWTGFCKSGIPLRNFRDYFTYSSGAPDYVGCSFAPAPTTITSVTSTTSASTISTTTSVTSGVSTSTTSSVKASASTTSSSVASPSPFSSTSGVTTSTAPATSTTISTALSQTSSVLSTTPASLSASSSATVVASGSSVSLSATA